MADGNDTALRAGLGLEFQDFFHADKLEVMVHLLGSHGRRFDGAGKIFPNTPEVFPRQRADFHRRFFMAEAHGQVAQRHAPVPRVEMEGQSAGQPAEARDQGKRQCLNKRDQRAGGPVNQRVHLFSIEWLQICLAPVPPGGRVRL